MKIKNSVNWLYKRFKDAKQSKYGSFKVSKSDFNALLDVVRYIDIQREEKVAQNTLFAKLYIYHLNNLIDTYKTDVLEEIPQKELSKMLNIPLEAYFKRFYEKIHNNWNDKMCEKLLKTKEFPKEYVAEKYTQEYCTEKLTEMINEALERFE
jgi:hypothetical protein